VLIPAVLIITLFFVAIGALILRSQMRRSMSGVSGLIGERGEAYTDLNPEGKVFVHGEYWQAVSEEPVAKGEQVEVLKVEGLKIFVRKAT